MMRVKCNSDFVTVFPPPPGDGLYPRHIDCVTIGNVYEVIRVERQDYYEILPDSGLLTIELPSYMFTPTDEPVTVNESREADAKKKQEQCRMEKES